MKKLFLFGGLAAIIALAVSKASQAVYTYTNGAYTVLITAVDTAAQGFSFAILVNGAQIFADNYYYGDVDAGSQVITDAGGDYNVQYAALTDDQVMISLISKSTGKTLFSQTLYLNGTQVSKLVTPDPLPNA